MRRFDDANATRSSLIAQLKDWSEHGQWERFDKIYRPLIHKCASRFGLTPDEAQEATQATICAAMENLQTFEYNRERGSFRSWLMQLARWRILDHIRKRDAERAHRAGGFGAGSRTATVERQPNQAGSEFEVMWDEEWKSELLRRAATKVKEKVDPKHYQIFDLLFFKKWSVARVAKFLDISAGRAYLIRHRVGRQLTKEAELIRDTLI